MKRVNVTLELVLTMVMLGMGRQDDEMCETLAEWLVDLSDLDIYDFSRSYKAEKEFNDQDFENVKSILLEFRERYLHGSGSFDLGSLYKDRPTLKDLF